MNPSLVILAAGIGSRYGSLKQIDKVGPNGETILDYSITSAISAGFRKIVFVIRREIEEQFRDVFFDKYSGQAQLSCVYQEINAVPGQSTVNPQRAKPWGTGHAVLMAKDAVQEPFLVIGCDDFYGHDAFVTSYKFLKNVDINSATGCLVGYYLKNTLSEHGSVSRGICKTDANNNLVELTERLKIKNTNGIIQSLEDEASPFTFTDDTVAAMSFYGFTPQFLTLLEEKFLRFIAKYSDDLKKEFYITTAMGDLIKEGKLSVKVFNTSSKWFGITNPDDKPVVMQALKELAGQ